MQFHGNLKHQSRVAQHIELGAVGGGKLPAQAEHQAGRKSAVIEGNFVGILALVAVQDACCPLCKKCIVLSELLKTLPAVKVAAVLAKGVAKVSGTPDIGVRALFFQADHPDRAVFGVVAVVNAVGRKIESPVLRGRHRGGRRHWTVRWSGYFGTGVCSSKHSRHAQKDEGKKFHDCDCP
jgi:hypothetical protein